LSIDYMGIKRTNNAMELALTPECADFNTAVLTWWFEATVEMYRRGNTRAVLDGPTQAFVDANRHGANTARSALSMPGKLLLQSTITAYESHLRKGIDKNLLLIAAAYEHALKLAACTVEKKSISYTLKKHRDNSALRVMTVRSDVLQDFGFEGASLALTVLVKAVERDLNKKVSIWNLHEVFGQHDAARVSPDYVSDEVFFLHTHLVEYLCSNLTLAEVKANLGVIKTLNDYFVTLEIPA
jgi:hypothetical protein